MLTLISDLEAWAATEASAFRAMVLSEDAARLRRAVELARTTDGEKAFLAAARRLGWTAEDRRTHELHSALDPLLAAVWRRAQPAESGSHEVTDEAVQELWFALDRLRMERLVGCLARVPRPE